MFVVTVIPGKQFSSTEKLSNPKVNQLGRPVISIEGNLADLDDVATAGAINTQPLVWNSSAGEWQPGTAGGSFVDAMIGASALTVGVQGVVPTPNPGDNDKFLRGDGTWSTPSTNLGNDLFNVENLI